MDLIALAIPFFLALLLFELVVDVKRGSGYFRANDAINSLSTGMLSTTFGYFTKLLPLAIWGVVLEKLAILEIPLAWFDASPRGILLWVLAAVAWDFCYYWFHRCSHEVSVLWAAHAVHHQSEDYNLSTALRQTSTGFLFGWVFYLPLFLLGFPLEAMLAVNAVNLIYQFWVHTQHVGRLGILDRILVTPSNHRVHHARNDSYIDKNYGGIFILWDRLFGTFADERADEAVVFGVRKPLESWNPFWANLQVYESLWFDARHTARWPDKLKVWFARTGWRPSDVSQRFPERSEPAALTSRYDPAIGNGLGRYALWQFLAAVALTLAIGRQFAADGVAAVLLPCAMLWLLLYSLGRISEGRGVRAERYRLLVFNPLLLVGMAATGTGWELGGGPGGLIVVYTATSILALQIAQSQKYKSEKTMTSEDIVR
ncbi:MAG: sterol desaturase family protein [Pseudomonadota bacterium]